MKRVALLAATVALLSTPLPADAHVLGGTVPTVAGSVQSMDFYIPSEMQAPLTEVTITLPSAYNLESVTADAPWVATNTGFSILVNGASASYGYNVGVHLRGQIASPGSYWFAYTTTESDGSTQEWDGHDLADPYPAVNVKAEAPPNAATPTTAATPINKAGYIKSGQWKRDGAIAVALVFVVFGARRARRHR